MDFNATKVAVLGLGVSNTPLIRYLAAAGARITVFDRQEAGALTTYLEELADLPLDFSLGQGYLERLQGFEYLFLTPGMKKNLPELEELRRQGVIFSSEMAVFLAKCPARTIGITGSSGKTTTTTLTGQMLTAQYPDTLVGGNIGRSLMGDLPQMNPETRVVLELSSFQLQELKQSPQLAVVTNIAPNHLDVHESMTEYIEAKSNILRYQTPQDIAILNYDNHLTRNLTKLVQGRLYYVSRETSLPEGAYLDGATLKLALNNQTETITTRERLQLPGDHNIDNLLTAALIARLSGVPLAKIREVAENFTGVEHRLELVREIEGVRYYNDSIATTPDRAVAGIKAIPRPIVLIAGGYDKKIPFTSLAEAVANQCRQVILLGTTAPLIRQAITAIQADFPLLEVKTLEQGVALAARIAQAGEAVLLSPACASYDMFANYQERGRLFKKLVAEI